MAKIYIDAAATKDPKIAACSAVIQDDKNTYEFVEVITGIDNHEAEWNALILSLNKSLELNIQQVIIYTDSQIVVDTIEKRHTKNKLFKTYYEKYQSLEQKFELIFVSFVPRKSNRRADALAKDALYKYKQLNDKKNG